MATAKKKSPEKPNTVWDVIKVAKAVCAKYVDVLAIEIEFGEDFNKERTYLKHAMSLSIKFQKKGQDTDVKLSERLWVHTDGQNLEQLFLELQMELNEKYVSKVSEIVIPNKP